MKARNALRELAEMSAPQWGMVTSAQAAARGVTRLDLSRLTESGDLVRLAHGVYKDAGAPSGAHLDVRAGWLSSEPARLASDRLADGHRGVVVSGQTAAWLHDIGDLRSNRTELTSPVRRQTQRADLHYRRRDLPEEDVTVRDGLPVTTLERTIADLVEDRTDLSVVADALRDASRKSELDLGLLANRLAPLAERNGHRKGDGVALLDKLLVIAGLDRETIARQIASLDGIGALVARNYLMNMPKIDFAGLVDSAALQSAMDAAVPQDIHLEAVLTALSSMNAATNHADRQDARGTCNK
ncbi:type IV toxin-antitoxin system AbiEi family antitoxin domain-containing protein [Microbacterium sp. LRZ72]|uniref:type IV toxin-antitoxin system AbiEi family antitoxin domain-containing protein n=1 Tax=Microbacterium sp. LRZ72 TaxID=2942481 RepID=UPI0029AD6E3F|nr:type IV toxin-antitoxin system AbiEi family antitoxin domain-containing protein [Microbacterium sp. LRZ72]MDX2376499.1 type IV toxin-antitoxin system AbiEi family antitoxin domain-containing protein [Microbacterium sp. LRZ72]